MGNIIGLVGISADITERKIAEEKLRRFASQLERSNDELRDFASPSLPTISRSRCAKFRRSAAGCAKKCEGAMGRSAG